MVIVLKTNDSTKNQREYYRTASAEFSDVPEVNAEQFSCGLFTPEISTPAHEVSGEL